MFAEYIGCDDHFRTETRLFNGFVGELGDVRFVDFDLPQSHLSLHTNDDMDFSLHRIQQLLSGLPPYTRPTIHVAGTNGKGSVTALLDAILHESGHSTGRFNSPHLLTSRDSILINGKPVSMTDYNTAVQHVQLVNQNIGVTSFELLTATALLVFEKMGVDIAIVEVGLGGRLDATNALPDSVILVSAITAIDLDHTGILGGTIEEIASEKAGIARAGVPCVLGKQAKDSVYVAVKEVAENRGARLLLASESVSITHQTPSNPADCHSSHSSPPQMILVKVGLDTFQASLHLHGAHQLSNALTAIAVVRQLQTMPSYSHITSNCIAAGLSNARWPGRLEWVRYVVPESRRTVKVLVDGAHNSASSRALASYLVSNFPPVRRSYVVSLSHSPPKSPRSVLEPLLRSGDRVAVLPFTPVEGMPWIKPVPIEILLRTAQDLTGDSESARSFVDLMTALEWVTKWEDPIVVFGSLYLVADLYRLVGRSLDDTSV